MSVGEVMNGSLEAINNDELHTTVGEAGSVFEHEDVIKVIVVYQDLFTCGTCSNQSVNILEHLQHKTKHPLYNVFRCELCQMIQTSHLSLLKHYGIQHGLSGFLPAKSDTAQNITCSPQSDNVNGTKIIQIVSKVISSPNDKCMVADRDNLEVKADGLYESVPGDGRQNASADKNCNRGVEHVVNNVHNLKFPSPVRENTEIRDLTRCTNTVRQVNLLPTKTEIDFPENTKITQKDNRSNTGDIHQVTALNHLPSQPKSLPSQRSPVIHVKPTESYTNRTNLTTSPSKDRASTVIKIKPYQSKFQLETLEEKESSLLKIINKNADSSMEFSSDSFPEEIQCLHCDFGSKNREIVASHMSTKHKTHFELPGNLAVADAEDAGISPKKLDLNINSPTKSKKKRPRKIEKQDIPGVYICPKCGKNFRTLRYLRKHMKIHRNEQFICDICGKSFKCQQYLKAHIRTHETHDRTFSCSQCDYTSSVNAAIHAHRQLHSQGSVLCDICGYAYMDKGTLAKHKRVHDPQRPFVCTFPGCTWRFKTDIMCKAHIRAHTTEGKFQCSYCGYVFRHKHHLQRHESKLHGIVQDKSRQHVTKKPANNSTASQEVVDNVNVLLDNNDEFHATQGLELDQQFLVIQPDQDGMAVTYTCSDMPEIDTPYMTLIPSEDIQIEGVVDTDCSDMLITDDSPHVITDIDTSNVIIKAEECNNIIQENLDPAQIIIASGLELTNVLTGQEIESVDLFVAKEEEVTT